MLQPAEPFLDLSGEDIRRRMFVDPGRGGAELCLRPEYTIPVCREHLAARRRPAALLLSRPGVPPSGRRARRVPAGRASSRSAGRTTPAADAEVLGARARGPRGARPARRPRSGSATWACSTLLDALERAAGRQAAPPARASRPGAASTALANAARPRGQPAMPACSPRSRARIRRAARAFVEDVLSIAGIARGRRPHRRRDRRALPRPAAAQPTAAPARRRDARGARALPRDRGRSGRRGGDAAGARARRGPRRRSRPRSTLSRSAPASWRRAACASTAFRFSAGFARNLDYYTGFIFEVDGPAARRPAGPSSAAAATTGCSSRSARPRRVPAVGCAFWLDRLAEPAVSEP